MAEKEVKPKAKKGFAALSPERQAELRAKSLETRKRKKELKEKGLKQANDKRQEADALEKRAEQLRQEADEIDGQCLSQKNKKKREAELCNEIDERFRDSVAPQYLKMMKQYAVQRNLSVDQLVTPSHAAMDILHDPDASVKERQDAMKTLQQFENAKPQAKTEDDSDAVGSVQEEFDKIMSIVDQVSPKR